MVGGPAWKPSIIDEQSKPSHVKMAGSFPLTKSHFSSTTRSGRGGVRNKKRRQQQEGGWTFVRRSARSTNKKNNAAPKKCAVARAVNRIAGYYDALEEKENQKVSTSCVAAAGAADNDGDDDEAAAAPSEAPNSSCQGTTETSSNSVPERKTGAAFRLFFGGSLRSLLVLLFALLLGALFFHGSAEVTTDANLGNPQCFEAAPWFEVEESWSTCSATTEFRELIMVVDGSNRNDKSDMTEVTTDADLGNPQCFEAAPWFEVEESWSMCSTTTEFRELIMVVDGSNRNDKNDMTLDQRSSSSLSAEPLEAATSHILGKDPIFDASFLLEKNYENITFALNHSDDAEPNASAAAATASDLFAANNLLPITKAINNESGILQMTFVSIMKSPVLEPKGENDTCWLKLKKVATHDDVMTLSLLLVLWVGFAVLKYASRKAFKSGVNARRRSQKPFRLRRSEAEEKHLSRTPKTTYQLSRRKDLVARYRPGRRVSMYALLFLGLIASSSCISFVEALNETNRGDENNRRKEGSPPENQRAREGRNDRAGASSSAVVALRANLGGEGKGGCVGGWSVCVVLLVGFFLYSKVRARSHVAALFLFFYFTQQARRPSFSRWARAVITCGRRAPCSSSPGGD